MEAESCVRGRGAAVQAVEVGFAQDAVDVEVGALAHGARFGGVGGATWAAGASGAVAPPAVRPALEAGAAAAASAAAAPCCPLWTAYSTAITAGRLRIPDIPAQFREEWVTCA